MKAKQVLTTASALIALIFLFSGQLVAQIIVTNSKVTYAYQQSVTNSFVPVSPLVSETPDSRLAFAPSLFSAAASGGGVVVVSTNAVLTVDMRSAPSNYFTGNAVAVQLLGSYALSAPFSTSEAFASVSGNYTLYLEEVNDVAYSSPAPMSGSFSFAPSNVFTLVGPGTSSSGSWNSSVTLDINMIKAHFGIGSSDNVTGLRLQYSQVLTAASKDGSATVNLLNANITNQVVPEPSTYALLALSAFALGGYSLRRKLRLPAP